MTFFAVVRASITRIAIIEDGNGRVFGQKGSLENDAVASDKHWANAVKRTGLPGRYSRECQIDGGTGLA